MQRSIQKLQKPEFRPSQEYLAREKRIDDATRLRRPDRVPVVPLLLNYYPTRISGISNKDAILNPDRTFKVISETTVKHNWDAFAGPLGMLIAYHPMKLLGMKQIKFPGIDFPEEKPYKLVEDEYMAQDEYDEFINDPNGFVVKKLWPRISETLNSLSKILQNKSFSFLYGANPLTLPRLLGEFLSSDEGMIESLKKIIELAEYFKKNENTFFSYIEDIKGLGYPPHTTGMAYPAFEWISTNLRGLRGILIDMYKVPDKLLSALEVLTPYILEDSINDVKNRSTKRTIVKMHHGAAEFMAEDQYRKFYWPYLKDLLMGLIDAGLMPVLIFEGESTSVLNLFRDMPPGKITAHFDKVDRKKAKETIGDVMCFWGNVPEKLLCEGTVQQVKDDVRELIDTFGENGGIIIDGAAGIPTMARPENVDALMDAAHEYGTY